MVNQDKVFLIGDSGRLYTTEKKYMRFGISSMLKLKGSSIRRRHFILLDYDGKSLEDVKYLIQRLRVKYRLPRFYVFKTSKGNYSAVCFKSIKWVLYRRILFDSGCCVNFRYYTINNKCGTLRISKKPEKKTSKLALVDIINPVKSVSYDMKEDTDLRDSVFNLLKLEGVNVIIHE